MRLHARGIASAKQSPRKPTNPGGSGTIPSDKRRPEQSPVSRPSPAISYNLVQSQGSGWPGRSTKKMEMPLSFFLSFFLHPIIDFAPMYKAYTLAALSPLYHTTYRIR